MGASRIQSLIILLILAPTTQLRAQDRAAHRAGALSPTTLPSRRLSANADSYKLQLPVNEVEIMFRAFGADGASLLHLTADDLRLWDDGRRQNRLVMLEEYQNLPIRAGFISDVSGSMSGQIRNERSVVQFYASRLFRQGVDRGFLMEFDIFLLMVHNWTTKPSDLFATAKGNAPSPPGHLPLTSIYDSLYKACRDQWTDDRGSITGNFILLFSDGRDDASHVYPSEVVDMCQRKRVAIYAITFDHKSPFSSGQRNLEELTSETGGRLFFAPKGDQLLEDLQIIEAEQRDQYRLVYRPSNFRANDEFHHLKLRCSIKGATIISRSGYYALARH